MPISRVPVSAHKMCSIKSTGLLPKKEVLDDLKKGDILNYLYFFQQILTELLSRVLGVLGTQAGTEEIQMG